MLFALALVGLELGAAASVFGNGLLGHRTAGNVDTALALAEEKLAAAGVTEPLRPGRTDGVFAARFAWRLAVAAYDDPDAAAAAGPAAPVRLYRIEARIAWRDGIREREVALDTLRLAPAPPP